MKNHFFVFSLIIVSLISCKKHEHIIEQVIPKPVTDAREINLKDIHAEKLPDPYYHFEYDSFHFVKKISFASGYFIYNVDYENGRVSKITNLFNNSSLVYKYLDGDVSEINEYSGINGKLVFNYRFSYNTDKKLIQVLWYRYQDNGESFLSKKADILYHEDGNIASIDWYEALSPGPLSWSLRNEFSDYDNKINVTGIVLLKENYFFDSYLFLPHVTLQKTNPLKEHIISSTNEYFISNTYDYQNNLPVTKTSIVNQTLGNNLPGPITVTTNYSY